MATLLHLVHGVIIAIGALAVLGVLLPSHWRQRRSLRDLKEAVDAGSLVQLAEARAAETLAGEARRPALTGTEDGSTQGRSAQDHSTQGRGWLVGAALTSVIAAVVHGAVGPEHFREALRLGLFFVVICAAELALAALILRRPTRSLVVTTAVINAGTVLLWILTRTVGLPFDLAEVEPVGVLDTIASASEVILVGCCLRWLVITRAPRVAVRSAPERHPQRAVA